MAVLIQLRGGTAAQWTAANPVLAAREMGLEVGTGSLKIGDGVTPWNSLPYAATAIVDGSASYDNLADLSSSVSPAFRGQFITTADRGVYVSDGGAWQTLRDPAGTFVPNYGVTTLEDHNPAAGTGNPVIDDAALQAARLTGKHISLLADKTYTTFGQMTLGTGQDLYAPSSVLKRCAQVSHHTDTPTNGVTKDFVMDSVVGFLVGHHLTFADDSVARIDLLANVTVSTNGATITAIFPETNTIRLDKAPNKANHTGHLVYTTGTGVELGIGSRISAGITIDGNKAENPWSRWESVNEISLPAGTAFGVVERPTIINAPGEGIMCKGDHHELIRPVITSPGGNGIHLGSTHHCSIVHPVISNPNQDLANGHQDGCITWSQQVVDTQITDVDLTGGLTGVSMTGTTNSDNGVSGGTIRGAINTAAVITSGAGRTIFSGVRIYDSGLQSGGGPDVTNVSGGMVVDMNLSQPTKGDTVLVTACQFYRSPVTITDALGVAFDGNQLKDRSHLTFSQSSQCSVSHNKFYGSLFIPQTLDHCSTDDNEFHFEGDVASNITVFGGTLGDAVTHNRNKYWGGLKGVDMQKPSTNFEMCNNEFFAQAGTAAIVGRSDGTARGVAKSNRASPSSTSVNWTGIQFKGGIDHEDNYISNPYTSAEARYGIRETGAGAGIRNTVRGAYNLGTIYVDAGTTGLRLDENNTDAPIVDNGTGTVKRRNLDPTSTDSGLPVWADVGSSLAAVTADASLVGDGGTLRILLTNSDAAITITNLPAGKSIELELEQDVSGTRGFHLVHATQTFRYEGGGGLATPSSTGGLIDRYSLRSNGMLIFVNLIGKGY